MTHMARLPRCRLRSTTSTRSVAAAGLGECSSARSASHREGQGRARWLTRDSVLSKTLEPLWPRSCCCGRRQDRREQGARRAGRRGRGDAARPRGAGRLQQHRPGLARRGGLLQRGAQERGPGARAHGRFLHSITEGKIRVAWLLRAQRSASKSGTRVSCRPSRERSSQTAWCRPRCPDHWPLRSTCTTRPSRLCSALS